MRLICPNCGAQYEVPESVIPETGRDVQCSSCGHTWFQNHPAHDSAAAADAAAEDMWEAPASGQDAQAAEDGFRPAHDAADDDQFAPEDDIDQDAHDDEWEGFPPDPGLDDAPTADRRLVPDPEDALPPLPPLDEDDYEEDPARDLPTPRRSLDTSVADLLREEAEREARARAAERDPGLESQPDLGLETGPSPERDADALRRAEESRLRMARLRGEEQQPAPAADEARTAPRPAAQPARYADEEDQIAAAAAAAVAESRRGLLPDIEEINSSLSSTSDRRPARADDHDRPGRMVDPRDVAVDQEPRGFARGFALILLLAVLLVALYLFAPALAEAVPAASPALETYVTAVNEMRVALDAQFQKLSVWLAGIAGQSG